VPKFFDDEVVASWFGYHPPSSPQIAQAHEHVRYLFGELGVKLNNLLPEGPDKTTTLRALREAMYQANASIAVAQAVYTEE
jgi:hypothetical protein